MVEVDLLHAGLGHFGRRIAVEELGEARSAGKHREAGLEELVVRLGRLVVDRQLAKDSVHLRLLFLGSQEGKELLRVFLVLGARGDVECVGRGVLGFRNAGGDFGELQEADLVLLEPARHHRRDSEIAH